MKKVKSPIKKVLGSLFQPNRGNNDSIGQLYKAAPIVLKTHDQEHKRNANSIKKVLKELQQLKKQLKGIKTINRNQSIPQNLDNSKCRKLNAQTKRSSPQNNQRNNSISKSKSPPQSKQNSTQTKRLKRNINQFSFSIHEKTNRSVNKNNSSQQDSQQYDPFSHKKSSKIKKQIIKSNNKIQTDPKNKLRKEVESIEAAQQYERHLHHLKNSFQILPITGSVFSFEDRLKINIEVQRFSNQIRRIPIYMHNPEQYYQIAAMYARSLNNQLNNFVLVLNRCSVQSEVLKQKPIIQNQIKQPIFCKNCEQNQLKDLQRMYKKQLKRLQKQLKRNELKLQKYRQQMNILTTQNLILMRQKNDRISTNKQLQKRQMNRQQKIKLLQQQIQNLQQSMKQIELQRMNDIKKYRLQQQDIIYYKNELLRIKNIKNIDNLDDNILIKQLLKKQQLYESIIKDKQIIINQLKMKINNIQSRNNIKQDRSQKSIDSAEYYQLKLDVQDRNNRINQKNNQIQYLKQQFNQAQVKIKQQQISIHQCMEEINRLNAEIEALEESNQKIKDRYLKTKVKNEGRSKREIQNKGKKVQVFQQINDLIQHHRQRVDVDVNTK